MARVVAASAPIEGNNNPLMEYVETISFDTEEERKAAEAAVRPEDNLQIGGFERLSHFVSMTR